MSEYPSAGNPDYRSGNGLTARAQRAMMEAEREAHYNSLTSGEQTIGCTPKRDTLSETMQALQKVASDNQRMAQNIEMALFGVTDPVDSDQGGEYSIERRAAETLDDLRQTHSTLQHIWERLGE